MVWCSSGGAFAFLSTLSLRRATGASHASSQSRRHFYPRSPCGERPLVHQLRGLADVSISIHALLAESDHNTRNNCIGYCDFYPRSPCGERPFLPHMPMAAFCHFYPRSPCGERLVPACCSSRWRNYFYPRSPCGERRRQVSRLIIGYTFLSTLSLRRATLFACPFLGKLLISIHALLAESDLAYCTKF